jgi:hypothetical protein
MPYAVIQWNNKYIGEICVKKRYYDNLGYNPHQILDESEIFALLYCINCQFADKKKSNCYQIERNGHSYMLNILETEPRCHRKWSVDEHKEDRKGQYEHY